MGGAQRAFGKKAKNPVEMQKLFFASQEQKRLIQRSLNSRAERPGLEPFLQLKEREQSTGGDKNSAEKSRQMNGSELSRDEMALLAPAEVKKDVPLLAVWLDN